ncbi:splicing factor, arginine/serine-rich 19 [Eucalyptus grandis]|uniref:splicing factor, arginine/serine-rich 19 n=1 Tax=Eucalyptus grandis TaxID=71139 RepID=UPI00192E801A|nr:splicing factor, arginine/serine-rich 19 [Eucalyptus grandis]
MADRSRSAAAAAAAAAGRRQPSRLQRRAPASLQIASPASQQWNVAIPLLSPLASSPTSPPTRLADLRSSSAAPAPAGPGRARTSRRRSRRRSRSRSGSTRRPRSATSPPRASRRSSRGEAPEFFSSARVQEGFVSHGGPSDLDPTVLVRFPRSARADRLTSM